MKLKFNQRIGTLSGHGMISCGEYAHGGDEVTVIGRTAAARDAETSMGSHKVEVIIKGRRCIVDAVSIGE